MLLHSSRATVATWASVVCEPVFSEPIKQINYAKFGGKVHFHRISRASSVSNFAFLIFSSALCYCTAELLLSCRHPLSVRPLSVKTVFSEPVKHSNAKFGGNVPFHRIFKIFGFYFFAVSKFYIFHLFTIFSSFSLTWGYVRETTSNDIFSESTQRIHYKKNRAYFGGGGVSYNVI